MAKSQPVTFRMYFEPDLAAIVRLVNYGGIYATDFWREAAPLVERLGHAKAEALLCQVAQLDLKTGVLTLWPDVRKACWGLLGPPPEHPEYAEYYRVNNRTPPASHRPPGERETPRAKRPRRKKE